MKAASKKASKIEPFKRRGMTVLSAADGMVKIETVNEELRTVCPVVCHVSPPLRIEIPRALTRGEPRDLESMPKDHRGDEWSDYGTWLFGLSSSPPYLCVLCGLSLSRF